MLMEFNMPYGRSKKFDGARKALIDFCSKHRLGYVNMPDELGTAIVANGK